MQGRYFRDSVSSCNIYAVQQDTQGVSMSEFIHHVCQLDMFRTSPVHHQERFVQAVVADLVCGNTRTTRHVQPLGSCSYNFVKETGAQGRQPYHLHVPIVLKSGILNLLEPSGPTQACIWDCFAFLQLTFHAYLKDFNVNIDIIILRFTQILLRVAYYDL